MAPKTHSTQPKPFHHKINERKPKNPLVKLENIPRVGNLIDELLRKAVLIDRIEARVVTLDPHQRLHRLPLVMVAIQVAPLDHLLHLTGQHLLYPLVDILVRVFQALVGQDHMVHDKLATGPQRDLLHFEAFLVDFEDAHVLGVQFALAQGRDHRGSRLGDKELGELVVLGSDATLVLVAP